MISRTSSISSHSYNRHLPPQIVQKIVSGGQTGVDRAALDIAIKHNIDHGGWCPKGRLAEDNPIPLFYSLQETESGEYSHRTKQNIIDSDATLILVSELPIPENITDGTILTIETCREVNKLHLLIDIDHSNIDKIRDWIENNNIKVLNIAGPRESQSIGIYNLTYNFLHNLFGN